MPLSKRKRKYIAHETHEVDNSGKCKQQKTLRKFVLAKLPGTPKALKWPVSIEDCSSDEIIVYCRCDDHNYSVQNDQVEPFPGNGNMKGLGKKLLRKKILKLFLSDWEWALKLLKENDDYVGKENDLAEQLIENDNNNVWKDEDLAKQLMIVNDDTSSAECKVNTDPGYAEFFIENNDIVGKKTDLAKQLMENNDSVEKDPDFAKQLKGKNDDVDKDEDLAEQVIQNDGIFSSECKVYTDPVCAKFIMENGDNDEKDRDLTKQLMGNNDDVEKDKDLAKQVIENDGIFSGECKVYTDPVCVDFIIENDVNDGKDLDFVKQLMGNNDDVEKDKDLAKQVIENDGIFSSECKVYTDPVCDEFIIENDDNDGKDLDFVKQLMGNNDDVEKDKDLAKQVIENDGIFSSECKVYTDSVCAEFIIENYDNDGKDLDFVKQLMGNNDDVEKDKDLAKQLIENDGIFSSECKVYTDPVCAEFIIENDDNDGKDPDLAKQLMGNNDDVEKDKDLAKQVIENDVGKNKGLAKQLIEHFGCVGKDPIHFSEYEESDYDDISKDPDYVKDSEESDDDDDDDEKDLHYIEDSEHEDEEEDALSDIFPFLAINQSEATQNIPVNSSQSINKMPNKGKKSESTIEEDEAETFLKIHMQKITVAVYKEKPDGKRNYSKINACLFCNRLFKSKMSAHLESMHSDQPRVIETLLLPKNSSSRRKSFLKMENDGNYYHNVKVIEEGRGELIVARRPKDKSKKIYSASDFLPCEYCNAFYLRSTLWQHANKCLFKPVQEQPESNYLRNAITMLLPFIKMSSEDQIIINKVTDGMKETSLNPGLPKICREDTLIQEFIISLYRRLGSKNEQRIKDIDNIRTKVRAVARLLKKLNEIRNEDTFVQLTHFISGPNFNDVLKGVRILAEDSDSPQLALTLGHYIKHITLLKISLGIRNKCVDMQNEGRDFQFLYQAHWNNSISCVAARRQKLRRINKERIAPITQDLILLKNWCSSQMNECLRIGQPSFEQWKWMAELTIVRILLFNKRRVSEVQELKEKDFLDRRQEVDNEEILESLDVSERTLARRMTLIEVRGKSTRGIRSVFVLLTPDMVQSIQYLLSKRKHQNPYIFGRKNSLTPLDGCTAVRNVTSACPDLKKPENIRTTKLRRYLATTAQILDMKDSELKILADHMGHDINIHTNVYRLQSSIIERAKVARVLLASENGMIKKFSGRSLESIDAEELPMPLSYGDAWSKSGQETVDGSEEDKENCNSNFENVTTTKTSCSEDVQTDNTVDSDDDYTYDNVDIDGVHVHTDKVNGDRQNEVKEHKFGGKIRRVPWTETENAVLKTNLKMYLDFKKMPPGYILKKISNELQGKRTIPQIRTKCHNIISGKQNFK